MNAVCAVDEADPALVFVLRQAQPLLFRCIFKQPPTSLNPPSSVPRAVFSLDNFIVCFSIPRKEAPIAAASWGGSLVTLLEPNHARLRQKHHSRNTSNAPPTDRRSESPAFDHFGKVKASLRPDQAEVQLEPRIGNHQSRWSADGLSSHANESTRGIHSTAVNI